MNTCGMNGKIATSVSEVGFLKSQISVYPNPVTDVLTINTDPSSAGYIRLTDISGKVVKEIPILNETSFKLDLSNLKEGMYLLFFEKEVVKILRVNP